MALPFATSQLVRYVTDRVLENVMKQLSRPASGESMAALQAAQPDLAAVIGSLNASLVQVQRELTALEERFERLERRMGRLEKRFGWRTLAKVVLAVVVAFVMGFVLAQLLRLGGWMG